MFLLTIYRHLFSFSPLVTCRHYTNAIHLFLFIAVYCDIPCINTASQTKGHAVHSRPCVIIRCRLVSLDGARNTLDAKPKAFFFFLFLFLFIWETFSVSLRMFFFLAVWLLSLLFFFCPYIQLIISIRIPALIAAAFFKPQLSCCSSLPSPFSFFFFIFFCLCRCAFTPLGECGGILKQVG